MIKEHQNQHRPSLTKDILFNDKESWFNKYAASVPNLILSHPDVAASRFSIASMLIEAWNRNLFFYENSEMEPKPDEIDRMRLIVWLQQIASFTGLLSYEEIQLIRRTEGRVQLLSFELNMEEQLNFQQLMTLTRSWKKQGLSIGCFHGAFDPVTAVHLGCATEARRQCDRLLIGFDKDSLLRDRKGKDRPRYSLQSRRERFGSFSVVDGTFTLRANDIENIKQYIIDYEDLNIDFVFLSSKQEDEEKRLEKIRLAGAKPKYLQHQGDEFSATLVLQMAKEWGFIK